LKMALEVAEQHLHLARSVAGAATTPLLSWGLSS
jgi:hypothetical protein